MVMRASPDHVKCWLLLCSDLAIRSGTAAILGPEHYDKRRGTLTFRTKYQGTQTLPVTAELEALLDRCTVPDIPFVSQLSRGTYGTTNQRLAPLGRMSKIGLCEAFGRIRRSVGITRKLTPHDLRRTTVRRVYDSTKDLRVAQALLGHSDLSSTLWYFARAAGGGRDRGTRKGEDRSGTSEAQHEKGDDSMTIGFRSKVTENRPILTIEEAVNFAIDAAQEAYSEVESQPKRSTRP
jgi:hypothetical protein